MIAKSRRETKAHQQFTAQRHTITRHSQQVKDFRVWRDAHDAAACGDDQQGAVLWAAAMLIRSEAHD